MTFLTDLEDALRGLPERADHEEALLEVFLLVRDEWARNQVGPPMALLGCSVRNDYDDRVYRVASVGQDDRYAGGSFAQLVSLDERQDFLEVDVVSLLRDFAVIPWTADDLISG